MEVSYKRQAVVFMAVAAVALAATEIAVRHFGDPALDSHMCALFMDSILYSDVAHRDRVGMCREYTGIQHDRSDAKMPWPLPFDGAHVNINNDGFRGPPLDAFGSGSYTVYMLGGSTTYGLVTVADDRTIPALLERKLRDGGLDARVVNAGVPGASTLDERYRLEHDIAHRDPDMVITYDGANEWMMPGTSYDEFVAADGWVDAGGVLLPVHDAGGSAPNGTAAAAVEEGAGGPPDAPPRERERWSLGLGIGVITLVNELDYRTGIGAIKFLKTVMPVEKVEDAELDWVDYGPAIERRLRENWGGICEAGDRLGFTTVNFLQPHLGTGNRTVSEHELDLFGDEVIVGLDPPSYVPASKLLVTVDLDPAGYPPCRHVHDLRGVFDGMDGVPVYFDWHHMSGSGNDVVASAMYDVVMPLVLEDMAP